MAVGESELMETAVGARSFIVAAGAQRGSVGAMMGVYMGRDDSSGVGRSIDAPSSAPIVVYEAGSEIAPSRLGAASRKGDG